MDSTHVIQSRLERMCVPQITFNFVADNNPVPLNTRIDHTILAWSFVIEDTGKDNDIEKAQMVMPNLYSISNIGAHTIREIVIDLVPSVEVVTSLMNVEMNEDTAWPDYISVVLPAILYVFDSNLEKFIDSKPQTVIDEDTARAIARMVRDNVAGIMGTG